MRDVGARIAKCVYYCAIANALLKLLCQQRGTIDRSIDSAMDARLGTRRFLPLNTPDRQAIPFLEVKLPARFLLQWLGRWPPSTSWEPKKESKQASQFRKRPTVTCFTFCLAIIHTYCRSLDTRYSYANAQYLAELRT